jgi:hypothetical protein
MIQQDTPAVRMFILADWVAQQADGKLAIGGAGIGQVFVNAFPGALPPMYVVTRVSVPWHMTTEPTPLVVRALDADRNTIGPDPLFQANAEIGRPPGSRPGDELAIQVAFPLTGYPVPSATTIFLHLLFGAETLAILPLKIAPRPQGVAQG